MNWGIKILIVYILFIAGIGFMVLKSSVQKTDLVTTDYYTKELKYQQKIDEISRVAELSAPIQFVINNHTIVLQFPKDFFGKKLSGEMLLYCPSDKNKDIKQLFTVQDEPLKIELPVTTKGLFQLQLSWQDGGVAYYFEKKISI